MGILFKILIFTLLLFSFAPNVLAEWTTARFNSNNTAAPPYSVADPIETLWTSQNYGSSIESPLSDNEDNIYFSSYNKGLVALDKNGNQKWVFAGAIQGSPVIDNEGNIYFVGGACFSIIFSLNKNGQERWHYDVRPQWAGCGNFLARPPVLSRDQKTVYSSVSYPSKTMLALNSNGTLKWQAGLSNYDPATITVGSDETIYVGTDGSGYLFAMDTGGAIKWQAFTASGWTVTARTPILDAVGNIYVVASGAVPPAIVSFNPSGQRRWIMRGSETTGFTSLPALKDQRLYTSEGAIIKAVDIANGATVWQWSPPFPTNRHLSPLTVDKDGNIYGTLGDKLFVIDPNGQTKNTITLGNYLGWVIIPQDDLILVIKTTISDGWVVALGKKQITKTPLIFIPGIGGSELKVTEPTVWNKDNGHGGTYNHVYTQDEKVWVNFPEARALGNDDYFDILRLKPDGQTEETPLVLNDTMYEDSYRQVIPFFEQNSYKLGQDFFVFNYDWRKDLSLTSILLDAKINSVLASTGASKVDIVTHSMGGLVAREYIRDASRAQKIAKLVQLGTPHLGAVKFIKAVNEGICLKFDIKIGCLSIAPSEIKDVLQNMPGGLSLLPSQKYYQFYNNRDFNHIFPVRDDADSDQNSVTGPLTFDQTKSWLINLGRNVNVFNMANTFHNNLDQSFQNSNNVDIALIAGSGLPTLGQIHTYLKTNWLGQQKKEQEEFYINGDQTVPIFSASLTDGATSLAGTNKIYYVKQEHGALMETGSEKPALPLVISLLANQPLPNGVAAAPFGFTGTAVSTHSPVELHVYDSSNNHTGPTSNGEFETQIPGSFYDTSGESKYIFLPSNGQYRFEIKGTDNGTFDLKLQTYNNNDLTNSSLYRDIPVTSTTIAQASYDTGSNTAPLLQIDTNGDGTIEQSINATSQLSGTQTFDTTSPITTATFQGTVGQNNWYQSDVILTLSAEDNPGGSGILTTEYSLDNGITVQTYTGPITLNQSATVKFRSIDKAGNEESFQEKEIKIDKTPPEAKVFVDQDKQDMVVEGVDSNPTTVTRVNNIETNKKDDVIYTITDIAGNTLRFDVRERDKEKQDRFRIYSMQYNDNPQMVLENNHFNVTYQGKKDKLNVKEQNFEIKGEIKIRIQYNTKRNQSIVIIKALKEEKAKETKEGLFLLKLITSNGQLYPQY